MELAKNPKSSTISQNGMKKQYIVAATVAKMVGESHSVFACLEEDEHTSNY